MPEKTSFVLVELSITVQQRGRSVIQGTMVSGDRALPFSFELTDNEIKRYSDLSAEVIADHLGL